MTHQLKKVLRLKIPNITMAMTVLRRSLMTTQVSSSKTAPSFSSQRDITKMETKLDLSKVGNKNVNVHIKL